MSKKRLYLIAGEFNVPEKIIDNLPELIDLESKGLLKSKKIFIIYPVFKKDLLK